jgi:uncharacterized protein involved in exopolysaccharide biosynthesis/Mrp family chromosome partitioning ATPase
MNERIAAPPPTPASITLGDVLYTIFRHKWKIVLLSLLGIAGSASLYFLMPPSYVSEAKLVIKYVEEAKAPSQIAANDPRTSQVEQGEGVINTEMEILTSYDLAQRAAAHLEVNQTVFKRLGEDTNKVAIVIYKGLTPGVATKSKVIRIRFEHSDMAVVQPVLAAVLKSYNEMHADVHKLAEVSSLLTEESQGLKTSLQEIESKLSDEKSKVGIVSLDDSKKAITEQIAKVQQAIFDTEAEMQERKATVNELSKLLGTAPPPATSTETNTEPKAAAPAPVPPQALSEYRKVNSLLDTLNKKLQDLQITFTAENILVKQTSEQVADAEKKKRQLEDDNPGLTAVQMAETPRGPVQDPLMTTRMALLAERAKLTALDAKVPVLTNQLANLLAHARAISAKEGDFADLERKRKLEADNYQFLATSLQRAKIEKAFARDNVSNIAIIQPSPPFKTPSKLYKMMAVVLLGGIAGAFALAFLIEMYVDRSVKRPKDIENQMGVPLFISIPRMALNGHSRKALSRGKPAALLVQDTTAAKNGDPAQNGGHSGDQQVTRVVTETHMAAWDPKHEMRPFSEALRDRLITYFELKNLTHKPKLVALTSCREGSGVSTVAASLAASLSETGEGNVLLVDMNEQNGAAHQFRRGDLACGLDEVLEAGRRQDALVSDNLYVATEGVGNAAGLPSVLPKRFKNLVPKLKASDYDYIIFDMPPVSQISLTPRLAKFMDMVLMVVESEKTDKDVVKQASTLLAESRANVGVVLNKTKTYVPKRLQQDL